MSSTMLRAASIGALSILGGFVFAACGGATSGDLLGGGTNGDGGGGGVDATADGGGGVDGGVGADGGALDGGGVDGGGGDATPVLSCDDLQKRVDDLRPAAIECLVSTTALQCDSQIDDLCCKATVNKVSRGGKAVKDFQAAVAAFKSHCTATCPAIPCHDMPSFVCVPGGLGGSCMP